jgi:hypothetical protein
MNKKLLLSTALVGSMITGSSAIAQTTVSGSLDLHYRAQKVSGGLNSNEGLARETQLNISNKGKLNNGWDYLAGFSLEFDGNQANPVSGTQAAGVYKTPVITVGGSGSTASVITAGSCVQIPTITATTTATSSDATEANSISNENIYIDFIKPI